MEYQKIINLLDNTPNHPSKFKTKNWVEINDESHGMYSTNSEINAKFKFFYYSDVYTLVIGTIKIIIIISIKSNNKGTKSIFRLFNLSKLLRSK